MTKSVLFLDNDFIGNIYGEISSQGSADRLKRALDALYEKYDVRITDKVYAEATANGSPTFAKDIAVHDWLNQKGITELATDVPAGGNVGERSIVYALENPGADPILSDPSVPKFIASNDGFFNEGGAGGDYADVRVKSFGAIEQLTVEGRTNILDYKDLSTQASPDAAWSDYRNVASDALTYKGLPTTYDPVEGRFNMDIGGSNLSISEGGVFKSAAAVSIGEYLGATGAEAQSLTNKINAKLSAATTVKALAAAGLAGVAADSAFSAMHAKQLFDSGDTQGGYEALGGLAGRLALGITMGEIGAIGGFAVGGPIGAIVGGLAYGTLGAIGGTGIGEGLGNFIYNATKIFGQHKDEFDFPDFLDTVGSIGDSVSNFFRDVFDDQGKGGDSSGGDSLPSPNDGNGNPLNPLSPTDPNNVPPPKSPLVLDIDGLNGVELTTLGTVGTYFDLDGNGQAELTAWAASGDGLLARDLNANGKIDDGSELFGNGDDDGFTVLRTLDSNADGKITSADSAWGELTVWIDANTDGTTQTGELHTLDSLGIASINLNATLQENMEISGNEITHTSTFTLTDGTIRQVVDAWFDYDPAITRNHADYDFDLRAAFLPTLRGFGDIKDLHIAASIDNGVASDSLMSQLTALATTTITSPAQAFADWGTIKAAVETLLLNWANVDGVDPDSRGPFVDARHLAFYEAFTGQDYTQYGRSNPGIEAGAMSEAMFDYIATYSTAQIVAQVIGGDLFANSPSYNLFTSGMNGDFTLSQVGIDAVKDAAIASSDPATVWAQFAQFLGYVEGLGNISAADLIALNAAVAATNDSSLDDWADVTARMTATLGAIIDSTDDWGSFEVVYDHTVVGTTSADTLTGQENVNDSLIGQGGNDILTGLSGHDQLSGGAGNDTLDGGMGDDYLIGGSGDDTFIYTNGNDTLTDISGSADVIHVSASTGLTVANISDIFRTGDHLVVQLDTGALLTIDGHFGASSSRIETLTFLSDNSTISLIALPSLNVYGTASNDTLTASSLSTSNALHGLGGNDKLIGGTGNDELNGGAGVDRLEGKTGDDVLDGGAGDDTLYAGGGNDLLKGGNGNDNLYGDTGNDIYLASAGKDFINSGKGEDTIQFGAGVTFSDLTFSRSLTNGLANFGLGSSALTDDLVISWGTNSITVGGQYAVSASVSDPSYVRYLTFDDNTVIDLSTIAFDAQGTENDDFLTLSFIPNPEPGSVVPESALAQLDYTVYGYGGNDVLTGGFGNDTLVGGSGNDIYTISYGDDVIDDSSGYDILFLQPETAPYETFFSTELWRFEYDAPNVTSLEDMVVSFGANGDVTMDFQGMGASVTLAGQANGTNVVEEMQYGYGLTLDISGIGNWIVGTLDNATPETLIGDAHAGFVNDMMFGYSGDDIMLGLSGNDEIYAGTGNDTLAGGTGDDSLMGGAGNDTLIGDNQDGTGDGWDYLNGGVGNDLLKGGLGDDFYEFNIGEGNDTIDDIGGVDDWLLINNPNGTISVGDLTFSQSGNNLLIDTDGTGNNVITILNYYVSTSGQQIEKLFLDYDLDTPIDLIALVPINAAPDAKNDAVSGDEDTVLSGNVLADNGNGADSDPDNNTLTVQAASFSATHGSVVLSADGTFTYTPTANYHGTDSFTYTVSNPSGLTDTATVNLVINAVNDAVDAKDDTFSVVYSGGDAVTGNLLADNGNGADFDADGDTLSIVGTTATTAQGRTVTLAANGAFIYIPSEDFLGTDIFTYTVSDGHGGTDTATVSLTISTPSGAIVGTVFNNTLNGTTNDDFIAALTGTDVVYASVGNDLIYGGSHTDTLNGDAGNDTIYGGTGSDVLSGGDGDDLVYGGDNNDTVNGGNGNDTLDGGLGTDTLQGGSGADLAIFGAVSSNFVIYRDNVDYITVRDFTNSTSTGFGTDKIYNDVETIIFNDTIFDLTTTTFSLNGEGWGVATFYGTSFGNTLDGTAARDIIYAGAGNDTLNGYQSADNLYGEANADTINGGDGNDLLDGGTETDTLNGGNGDDTLIGGLGTDVIKGDAGVDTAVWDTGSTGFIVYRDTAGYVVVRDTNNTGLSGYGTDKVYDSVESVRFNDVTLDLTTMSFAVGGEGWGTAAAIHGNTSNNTITGTQSRDLLYGDAGNDTLSGNQGNDDLYGEVGNDILNGNDGNDALFGGDGTDTLNSGNGNDVLSGGAGIDQLYGNAGADVFVFEAASAFGSIDSINDFSTSQDDAINITDLLIGYNPTQSAINDFVEITTNGANSILKVDRDGLGTTYNLVQIATVQGVTGITDEAALVTSGNLVVS